MELKVVRLDCSQIHDYYDPTASPDVIWMVGVECDQKAPGVGAPVPLAPTTTATATVQLSDR